MASLPIITVIGSVNTDLVTYTPYMPRAGETMTASSFNVGLGGKGANQAVACAKLSRTKSALDAGTAVVKMIGAVGSDEYGKVIRSGMKEFGVDVEGIQVKEGKKTGVAVIIVDERTAQNRIMFSPEANYTLVPEQFKHLPEPLPTLIILQLEIPLETVLTIMESAKKQHVPVLLNPAPAQKIPEQYYQGLSYLVVNETEAALLADCDEAELDTTEGLARVARKFKDFGVETVLITLGGRGVYYSSGAKEGHVPAEKANVVDTTAAGDTFIGAYALEVVKGDVDIEKAVRIANKAAAKTVERKGAQDSIPWLDELP